MSATLVVSMMAFNMNSYAQGTAPARKPIAESNIRFPDYFGTYAVLPNGETVLLDNPVNVATYDVPRRSLPYDVEFIIYGKNVDPSSIQLLSVPASRPRQKKQSEMQRLMDVSAMEEQMLESSGIPRGSKAGKLFVKPVSTQPQMFRLIPAGTLPGGVYQIGNSDDQWYRFVVGSASAQRASQGSSPERSSVDQGVRSGSQSSANNEVQAKLMSSTVQEPYGPKFLQQKCFKTRFVMSGITDEKAFYALQAWKRVLQQNGTIRSPGLDFFNDKHLEWYRMEGQQESLKLDVDITQASGGSGIGVTVQVSGRGGRTPSQEQAADEAAAVCDALVTAGGKLQ
jgi:hypothetical protein